MELLLDITQYILMDDGTFPNNASLPVLHYKNVMDIQDNDPASFAIHILEKNNWMPVLVNGLYTYHHYHSSTHEVIVVYSGNAKVLLGGPEGVIVNLQKGDVLVLPAGVAHKNIGCSNDFKCLGAYPKGQQYDINYGYITDRPGADIKIENLSLPESDPVFGIDGPLFDYWKLPVLN